MLIFNINHQLFLFCGSCIRGGWLFIKPFIKVKKWDDVYMIMNKGAEKRRYLFILAQETYLSPDMQKRLFHRCVCVCVWSKGHLIRFRRNPLAFIYRSCVLNEGVWNHWSFLEIVLHSFVVHQKHHQGKLWQAADVVFLLTTDLQSGYLNDHRLPVRSHQHVGSPQAFRTGCFFYLIWFYFMLHAVLSELSRPAFVSLLSLKCVFVCVWRLHPALLAPAAKPWSVTEITFFPSFWPQ